MGYQEGAFALGYVGDQQDPLAVLRGERRSKRTIGEFDTKPGEHEQFVDELESDRP